MRWCHHCRHYNSGWPPRCRYCAAGLAGRLCTRNHVNPLDWRLTFCGECGAPLTRISGAGISIRPYLVAGGIWLATWAVITVLWLVKDLAPGIVLVVMLAIGGLGGYLGWQILPPSAQRVLTMLFQFARVIVTGLVRLTLRLTFKGTRQVRTRLKGRR
jgi:hypothetical protein